jgi:hypothetical protein
VPVLPFILLGIFDQHNDFQTCWGTNGCDFWKKY